MDEAKFVILGSRGQLGTALCEKYPKARTVNATELDIANREAVQSFDWSETTTILNAAAYTKVDLAETNVGRIRAWETNASGPSNLAEIAIKHSLTLVHISTDYVFDGTNKNHLESEPFSPLGVYGQTKAAGDLSASLVPKNYILRTSWVIGEGNNFVRTMLNLAQRKFSPKVVADQVGRLTFTSELVRIIDHFLQTTPDYGTYNSTNNGDPASWADIARNIFKFGGFDLEVTDTTTEEYFAGKPGIAPRPLNSVMNLSKLEKTGFVSRDWHDDLKTFLSEEAKK